MSSLPSPEFHPPFWLAHRHAQTLYGALLAPSPRLSWIRQRWTTSDGDFIDVDRLHGRGHAGTLVIFHGLEGNTSSRYVRALAHGAQLRGWHVLAPNFRSCSGDINLRPRLYHAGDSREIHEILSKARAPYPNKPVYAVGISLGGNMLLKWLGEQGEKAGELVDKAVAVAAPLDLKVVGDHLATGFNRVYTRHFLCTLKRKALQKFRQFPGLFDLESALRARTLREFDDHFMAPVHGFLNAEDYWRQCSSKPWLAHIQLPTLLLNARDDPFLPESVLPQAHQCSPTVVRDFHPGGGHVGFVSGPFPGHLQWMPERVLGFLADFQF